ncbi:hypothetical protein GGX14DRAFT_406872 [Mycena pura]|uniref:Uncharacterized protein n=1 Tax=Mycena pura TaxID=153505 RepID=A0AAD6UTK4_9AGAR|nr:hypothetical protein GGX14DRAFT_406872 [Mycena pura]
MSGIFSGGGQGFHGSVNPLPIVVFDAVAVTATVSLALTLAPAALCSNVHRSKAWFSMITTMMIFPLLYLLNVGSQFHTEATPPIGLCILQAGFIYAAAFCFIADVGVFSSTAMTLGLRAMLTKGKRNRFFASVLIVMPSIIFACVFFEAIILVNGNRGVHFDSTHMFCESDSGGPHLDHRHAIPELGCCSILQTHQARSATLGLDTVRLGAIKMPNNLPGGAIDNIFLVSGNWIYLYLQPLRLVPDAIYCLPTHSGTGGRMDSRQAGAILKFKALPSKVSFNSRSFFNMGLLLRSWSRLTRGGLVLRRFL